MEHVRHLLNTRFIPFYHSIIAIGRRRLALCGVFAFVILVSGSLIYSSLYKKNATIQMSSFESAVSSFMSSSRTDSAVSTVSEGLVSIKSEIPVWYSPGKLDLNALYENMNFTIKPLNAPSEQYVYIRAASGLPFPPAEHKGCAYFRVDVQTGSVECVDHIIRAVLISKGLMSETDKIYFKEIPSGNHFVLFDVRNANEVYKSSFRFDLHKNEALKLSINLSVLEECYTFKDFSRILTTEYSSKWNILLSELDTGKKTVIPAEAEAAWALGLSPDNQYIWYSLKRNGNKYTRCIYNIATGEKSWIQSFSYLFFTPDDRFVLYFSMEGIRRLDLKTREDVVLLQLSGVFPSALVDIVAYNEQAGKIVLSHFVADNYYNLYSVDVHTGAAVEFMSPSEPVDHGDLPLYETIIKKASASVLYLFPSNSGSTISTPGTGSSSSTSGSMSATSSSSSGSASSSSRDRSASSSLYGSTPSSTKFGIISSSCVSSEVTDSSSNKDAMKPSPSITDYPQSEKETPAGARVYIFDKTHRYIYYFTDLNGNNESAYCYDIVTGKRIAIPLPSGFKNQIATESTDLLFPKQTFPLGYRLYLSDDSAHLYMFLDSFRDKSNVIPLSSLKDYAAENNTIIHFGKTYPNQKYDNFLGGRSYTIYTDNGKVAVLNENYDSNKFALVLFEKPFDSDKPFGGGRVLVEKDLPPDASFGLADWWENAHYNRSTVDGVNTFDIKAVLHFVETHDCLDGFTALFPLYSVGSNFAYADMPETGFFYQICVGPNEYVNVIEDYLLMKLQIQEADTGVIVFERDLKAGLKNSSHLPK